jgi:hypothetical protein
MNKSIVFVVLFFLALTTKAQKNYFIYLQTDNKQAFSVKMNGKDLSSTASGYIIIPKLPKGEHSFTISFPKNEWPKQTFNVLLNDIDKGYTLKNFSDKGWGLYNDQSMDIVMNGDPVKKKNIPNENPEVEIVKTTPAETIKQIEPKVELPAVKEVETPTAKVATNNANRAPVLDANTEPEVVKTTPKIVEKTVDAVKEIPAPKIEEKVVEVVKETPVIKEEKIVEKIKEIPVIKVEEKIAEKIVETPVVKGLPTETPAEEVVEKPTKKSKEQITKVSSYNDEDGVTITYKVVTATATETVPVFVERNLVFANEGTQTKSPEKFIEHIELANPNANKTEKVEDPATAKVATNNANRAPVETGKVEKVQVVDKSLKEGKVNQGEIIDYAEKIKKVEPTVEKKKEPIKTETPVVEKIVEKKEEPVVKVQAPVIIEKPVDYGNGNPLKITEAEKSSRDSRNITAINSDCADRKATEEDFFKTRKKIIAEDVNEDAMVDAALKQFKLKCYSVEQIKNLALVFLTDQGKYKLLDAAYPYTYESDKYGSLEPLFKETYFIKRFRVMLER